MKRSLIIGLFAGMLLTVGRLAWEIQEAGRFLGQEPDLFGSLQFMLIRPTVWWALLGTSGLCTVLTYPFARGGTTPAEKDLERQS